MVKFNRRKALNALIIGLLLAQFLLFSPVQAARSYAPTSWPSTSVWPNIASSDTYAYKSIDPVDRTLSPVRDLNGDQNPDPTDVSSHGANGTVGDWNSTYFYATSTHFFFRILINDDPSGPGGWSQTSWVVQIDANNDNVTDWTVGIAGVDEAVYVTCNTTGITDQTRSANPTAGYTRRISTGVTGPSSGKTMFYADWQIELTALSDGAGGCADIADTTNVRLFFGTSATGNAGAVINKDYFTGSAVDFTNMSYVNSNTPTAITLISLQAESRSNLPFLALALITALAVLVLIVYRQFRARSI